MRLLAADPDVFLRERVVLPLFVMQKDDTVRVAEFERPGNIGRHTGQAPLPHVGGDQTRRRVQERLVPLTNRDPSAADGAGRVQLECHDVAVADRMKDRVDGGPGDAVHLADGQPVFRECDALVGAEKRVGLLVTEESRLQFDVRAAIIGQRFAPGVRVAVEPPRPDLARRQLLGKRQPQRAGSRRGVPDTDERLPGLVGEKRDGAIGLIADDPQILAAGVYRPRLDSGEPMRRHQVRWIYQLRVVADFHGRVRPPVVPVSRVAAIEERRVLLQYGPAGPEPKLHTPGRSKNRIHIADPDRRAAVGVGHQRVIHRRHRHPVVRHGEVELDAEGGPGPAIPD